MSLDQLTKDPVEAAKILADLEKKDAEATVCRYPTCQEPRQTAPTTGRPAVYCHNPEHNPVTNHRARQYLKDLAAGMTSETAIATRESSKPAGMAPVESLRNSVVGRIMQLQNDMERYLVALTEIADPDLSAAQIRAALDQADARVAGAQQDVSVERSLRLAAETARTAAQEEARAEREAAEQAIQRMEEVETQAEQQKEEAERRIAEQEAEHAALIERLRGQAEQQRAEIEQKAKEAVTQAQTATLAAQEETRQAEARAQEARAQAAMAEHLVSEARTALDRERSEVDRLRTELAATVTDARVRAEADRAEARIALERERGEIDRLRTELAALRKQAEQATIRADKLAASNDELRGQLVQAQITEKEKPNRA